MTAAVAAATRSVQGVLADLQGALGLLESLRQDLRERPDALLAVPQAPAAEQPSGARPLLDDRLDDVCRKLLETVRERCPDLFPAAPLPAGKPAPPVPVVRDHLTVALSAAARTAAAPGDARREDPLPVAVLWQEGADQLLVSVARITVTTDDGLVLVHVPIACDQLPDGRGEVVVAFAVGAPGRPTGLLVATESLPRGPRLVVSRWGEALTALAWRALLDTAAGVAAEAGTDEDGAPLVPAALTATKDGLSLLPQARHPFDRVLPPRATSTARVARRGNP